MNRSMSENDSWNRQRYNNTSTVLVKQENAYAVRLNPALQLRYNRTLPKKTRNCVLNCMEVMVITIMTGGMSNVQMKSLRPLMPMLPPKTVGMEN